MMTGVLLAAGASARMGSPKALARQARMSYMARGIRHLWYACTNVVAVLGANAPAIRRAAEEEFARLVKSGALHEDLLDAHRHGAAGLEVHFELNPKWRSGMFSSVQLGLDRALALKPEGILVLPVDHPSVRPETMADLATVLRLALQACRSDADRRRFAYALVPRYQGRRGHPVALSPALARAVVRDRQAEDFSDSLRRHARLVGYLDVRDAGVVRNVNRLGD